ncbi:hypothetical protein JCM1840_006739 [Sporobolomyces johnsonii]
MTRQDNAQHGRAAQDDLTDWAPLHRYAAPTTAPLPHLPALPSCPRSAGTSFSGPTSHPRPSALQSSIAFSLSRLLSLPTFASFLASSTGYTSFHSYLLTFSSPSLPSLELWGDLCALRRITGEVSADARGMRDTFLVPGSEREVDMSGEMLRETVEGLRKVMNAAVGLEGPSQRLLERLYEQEFEAYVKFRLLSHFKIQLEKRELGQNDVAGLGEAFVLSNPRLHDSPIVLASPAFCALTGYSREEVIGRNCRFLQGDATSEESVASIRSAIADRRPITQLILNYDRAGAPFFNLLCMIPLFDTEGNLTYFIGGQTNVNGTLSSSSHLLLPGLRADGGPLEQVDSDPYSDLSPSRPSSPEPEHASSTSPPDVRLPTAASSGASFSLSGPWSRRRVHSRTSSASIDSTSASASTSANAKPDPLVPSAPATPSMGGRFRFVGRKATKSEEAGSPRMELGQGTVEKRLSDFQDTYSKVLLLRREGRKILFTTSSFLRFCGLPGASDAEVHNSALLHLDLLDLIRGESCAETAELKGRIRAAVDEGRACSVTCGIRVEERKLLSLFKSKSAAAAVPTARGVLHLTPLQDLDRTTSYIALFA